MILDVLAIAGFATFPGWREEIDDETGSIHHVKPFPSERILNGVGILLAAASVLGFVSVMWLHSAAVSAVATLKYGFSGLVDGRVGTPSMLLAWLGLVCTIIPFIGLVIEIFTVRLLDALTDVET